jgi:hypothetical protein
LMRSEFESQCDSAQIQTQEDPARLRTISPCRPRADGAGAPATRCACGWSPARTWMRMSWTIPGASGCGCALVRGLRSRICRSSSIRRRCGAAARRACARSGGATLRRLIRWRGRRARLHQGCGPPAGPPPSPEIPDLPPIARSPGERFDRAAGAARVRREAPVLAQGRRRPGEGAPLFLEGGSGRGADRARTRSG